ncbi:MAG: glyoxalase/bleomycin resistance/extradiol dioxygenase family protein, partial [Myxococcales bacterium]|nr:glyoxalase/bleomycin resistance/extradiol dioxygenase family protein [Myxococcales bacterium]
MSRKVFVNLPITNLPESRAFYQALGFTINEHFSDDTAACAVVSEDIYVMLLTHPKFKQFTTREIANTATHIQMLNALSCESKEEVDGMVEAAIAAGGKEPRPVQDLGFMYSRAFDDLDGHTW